VPYWVRRNPWWWVRKRSSRERLQSGADCAARHLLTRSLILAVVTAFIDRMPPRRGTNPHVEVHCELFNYVFDVPLVLDRAYSDRCGTRKHAPERVPSDLTSDRAPHLYATVRRLTDAHGIQVTIVPIADVLHVTSSPVLGILKCGLDEYSSRQILFSAPCNVRNMDHHQFANS
jgi:hypothetical protein